MSLNYMLYDRFDTLYDALPISLRDDVTVGGNLLGCKLYDKSGKATTFVRGLENQLGNMERRMLVDDFGLDTINNTPLGTGELSVAMTKELIDEGKIIPRRPLTQERRRSVAKVPTATWCTPTADQLNHDPEMRKAYETTGKDDKTKAKRTTKKTAKKRKRV